MKGMLKMLIGILFLVILLMCQSSYAQLQPAIDLSIIAIIESNNNSNAFNPNDPAYGKYQITQPCLDDYNYYNETDFVLSDMYSPEISETVARWYLNKRIPTLIKHFGLSDTLEMRIVCWNAGIQRAIEWHKYGKLNNTTKNYIKRYRRLL